MTSLIVSSGKVLNALLNDILDLARIDTGKIEITAAPFDLGGAIDEIAGLFSTMAEQKGLRFAGNAIKFTASGSVGVDAFVVQNGADRVLRVAVSDTGIGFDGEAMRRIFERFAQSVRRGAATALSQAALTMSSSSAAKRAISASAGSSPRAKA